MRFTPAGARELHHYIFVVITATDSELRQKNDRRQSPGDFYSKAQITVCDITGGVPMEVGTFGKPGRMGCEWEEFELLRDAIDRSWEIGGAETHPGKADKTRYGFVVITRTDREDRAPTSKPEWDTERYHLGQILVCDMDGIPMEVGTYCKPGRVGCSFERFTVLDQAIEFAYLVAGAGWDQKKVGRKKWRKLQEKKRRKQRHRA